jgi:signal transduction histidine kinase
MPLVKFTKPKTNAGWITDFISIVFAVAAAGMFIAAGAPAYESSGFSIGTLEFATGATADAAWGLFVYIALLVVAMVGNLLVSRADVTSEEDLEIERLAKVRLKQEKEEAERIRKQEAWLEEEKRKEAEHAEKVRLAREALNKDGK